jgi:hypothetical protein
MSDKLSKLVAVTFDTGDKLIGEISGKDCETLTQTVNRCETFITITSKGVDYTANLHRVLWITEVNSE